MKTERVELVVAHHSVRVARLNHRSNDLDNTALLGTSVNKVTHKDSPALGVLVDAVNRRITQRAQQPFELFSLTVDIPNHIKIAQIQLFEKWVLATLGQPKNNRENISRLDLLDYQRLD